MTCIRLLSHMMNYREQVIHQTSIFVSDNEVRTSPRKEVDGCINPSFVSKALQHNYEDRRRRCDKGVSVRVRCVILAFPAKQRKGIKFQWFGRTR